MAVKKGDKKVQEIYRAYGGANFADILNRLWLMGKDPKELARALATTKGGTNDPTDIIARLINSGVATEAELRAAPTIPVPGPEQGV